MFSQVSNIFLTILPDTHPGHPLGVCYLLAGMQSVYSATQATWASSLLRMDLAFNNPLGLIAYKLNITKLVSIIVTKSQVFIPTGIGRKNMIIIIIIIIKADQDNMILCPGKGLFHRNCLEENKMAVHSFRSNSRILKKNQVICFWPNWY